MWARRRDGIAGPALFDGPAARAGGRYIGLPLEMVGNGGVFVGSGLLRGQLLHGPASGLGPTGETNISTRRALYALFYRTWPRRPGYIGRSAQKPAGGSCSPRSMRERPLGLLDGRNRSYREQSRFRRMGPADTRFGLASVLRPPRVPGVAIWSAIFAGVDAAASCPLCSKTYEALTIPNTGGGPGAKPSSTRRPTKSPGPTPGPRIYDWARGSGRKGATWGPRRLAGTKGDSDIHHGPCPGPLAAGIPWPEHGRAR